MTPGRPHNQPPAHSPSGVRLRHSGAWAVRRARSIAGENALLMREAAYTPIAPARRSATVVAPQRVLAYEICRLRRLVRGHGVINVLCHDLPRRARGASIFTVEREAMHSRCAGRPRAAVPAGTGRCTFVDPVAVFIGGLRVPAHARHQLDDWALHHSDGSTLHLPMKCTSMLVNVYSGPGATRGKGSGGVGKRHAGDGSRH
jgi:hypothetical protein